MGANAFRVCDLAAIKRIDFSVCRFFQPKCCVATIVQLGSRKGRSCKVVVLGQLSSVSGGMPRIWWVNWPLSKGANLQESPYLVSGPMTHLSQQLTSLLTPARHSIWSPFDTCSNEFLATWQSKPTRSPCKFSFKTSRSCAWSGGSPVPVHTNNWLRVFLFNSCANGVGCRNAKRALTAKTTG